MGTVVDETPAQRVFDGDTAEEREKKIGWIQINPYLEDSIRSTNHRLDGDEEFLHDGYAAIDDAFSRLFPDIGHASATLKAKTYFKQAFASQLEQKKGTKKMKRKIKTDETHRKKFARRKAFIVASILAALRDEQIRRPDANPGDPNEWFEVYDVNRYVDGKDVTQKSKQKCWNELGVSYPGTAPLKPSQIRAAAAAAAAKALRLEQKEENAFPESSSYHQTDLGALLKKKRGRPPKSDAERAKKQQRLPGFEPAILNSTTQV